MRKHCIACSVCSSNRAKIYSHLNLESSEALRLALHAWQPYVALLAALFCITSHFLIDLCTADMPQPPQHSFTGEQQSQQWRPLLHAPHQVLCTLQICSSCHRENLHCSCAVTMQTLTVTFEQSIHLLHPITP